MNTNRNLWRKVASYPHLEARRDGLIRNASTKRIYNASKPENKPAPSHGGARRINVRHADGGMQQLAVQQLVAEAWLPDFVPNRFIWPVDGDESNCAASNLCIDPEHKIPPGKPRKPKNINPDKMPVRTRLHNLEQTVENIGVKAASVDSVMDAVILLNQKVPEMQGQLESLAATVETLATLLHRANERHEVAIRGLCESVANLERRVAELTPPKQ